MVLLSGSRSTGVESKGGKGKGDAHPTGDGGGGSSLLKDATEKEEDVESIDVPGRGSITWRGAADPLPHLLAIVPNLEKSASKSNGNVDEESEEYDDFSELPDTRSIASDDSFYPPDIETRGRWFHSEEGEDEDEDIDSFDCESFQSWESTESLEPLSLLKACSSNNAIILKALLRQGLSEDDVGETDRNNRTGLLIACYQGYVDIVIALSQCPHIDVNWQDNEGNTALITAAQAGHITITNYLLNYYPGLDLEKRNVHGFTALMKASMQGRTECVRALMLAGADIHAVDPNRGYTPREWARFTGRYETAFLMQKLMDRPAPEQFSDNFTLEWPKMKELLAKSAEPKSCSQRISDCIKSAFTFNYYKDPDEDGVIDHMVRITTSMNSPFVAVACRTVCPGSPPCVGKRRYSVQEILKKKRANETKATETNRTKSYEKLFQSSRVTVVAKKKERRSSLQTTLSQRTNTVAPRRSSLLPLNLLRRSSVRPGYVIPKVRISKAPTPTYYPEKIRRRSSNQSKTYLQIPKWRYKEIKEQRKKAEEEALRKAEEAEKKKQQQRPTVKKRTYT